MKDVLIGTGCDSNVYLYTINGQTQIRKNYYTKNIAMILQYHNIQNLYAHPNKKIKADCIDESHKGKDIQIEKFFQYILYKGQGINSISFSILPLDIENIAIGSDINGKREHVFTTPKYVPGDTLDDACQKGELTYSSLLDNSPLKDTLSFDRYPICALEDGVYSALAREYPVFKKMAEKDDMISRNLCCRKNIKIIKFENGHLELCITDLGGSIRCFVKNHTDCSGTTSGIKS